MLCDFLTFVAPCFLLLDKEPGEKCISQCHSLGRELPSFNTVQKFINVIRQLEKPSGADQTFALTASKEFSKIKVRFPIAVEYDFECDTWVDSHSRESVNELPWALGYPHLNNVLVLGAISTNSKDGFLTTMSQTPHTAFRFQCINRQRTHTVKVNRRMAFDAAVRYCAQSNADIKTPDENVKPVSDSLVATDYYWTGSLRHNLTHFKREDGILFEPEGITGTWRGFPSSVLMTIYKNGSIDAYTANFDRDCLCLLGDMTTMKLFFRHNYFRVGLFIALSIKCIVLFACIGWKNKQNACFSSDDIVAT